LLLGTALLLACGPDAGGGAASGSAKPAGSAAAPAKSGAAASAKPSAAASAEAPKVEMVEKDLSKVEAFKGWVAKGPADADVMEDLGGVRIVTKKVRGPGSFDLAFKAGKPNFKEMKDGHKKGAEIAKTTITYSVDTADALEWTSATESSKMYAFSIVMKVDGKDFTCYTVSPRETEAEANELKEACKTLAKK